MAISSMKPCFTNEMPLVGGARSAPTGMPNGVTFSDVISTFSTKPRGNSFAGHDGVRAGDEIAIRDELAVRVQPGLEEVVSGRAVLVVRHVVFARPQQLDRNARQPGGRPLFGDDPGDPRHFDVVLAHEPPAESAARAHEVDT